MNCITSTTLDYDKTIDFRTDLEDIFREDCDKSASEAALLAQATIAGLKKRMPGDTIYIASGLNSAERQKRDRAVRAEYNGRNRRELCAKYRLSKTRLYEILARPR